MIRQNAYRSLTEAEKYIRAADTFKESVTSYDYNNDGLIEYICRMDKYTACISKNAGAINELNIMHNTGNYADNLSRIEKFDKVDFKNNILRESIEKDITPDGVDDVEFLFSANLGQPMLPLAKIISGGELSRFMLAFKCVLNNSLNRTFIFDEIDTGIGGNIGSVVGEKICKISNIELPKDPTLDVKEGIDFILVENYSEIINSMNFIIFLFQSDKNDESNNLRMNKLN